MSKMSKNLAKKDQVINYMGGISYSLNPLITLKMVTTSSIFGEPAYYRDGQYAPKVIDELFDVCTLVKDFDVFDGKYQDMKTSEIMESVILEALDYDFKATIDFAVTLRNQFNMRLNPQVIMVLAASHPKRKEFCLKNPGYFSSIQEKVMTRADEPSSQLTYYLFKNKSKNKLPNILKTSWAKKLKSLSRYEISKYKNANVGMIDVVRISHASSTLIDELMQTGTIKVTIEEKTWENLLSSGKDWHYVLKNIKIGHMALLRNLRNIFKEEWTIDETKDILDMLKNGVLNGKQFPFRYYNAYKMLDNSLEVEHKGLILDALEECIDISMSNMPTLKGKTACLSDNSGSAWSTFNSEYGAGVVAEIGNLSSLIAAKNSEEGEVVLFGDSMKIMPVSKVNGLLSQNKELCRKGRKVGMNTENGIWLFFKDAIENKKHYDNIFIYSDMQAGHGGLYGINENEYKEYKTYGHYIDVVKLINAYRNKVNPKVNVFSVQTAGYENSVVPEYMYRCNILSGWTGKELLFAKEMISLWDEVEKQEQ